MGVGRKPAGPVHDRLLKIGGLFRKYLPEANIATYGRVNDFSRKSVDDLKRLREVGFNDIVIGLESGDDEALARVDKGYTVDDILRQCAKIEQAGIDYRVIYLGGIAGAGRAVKSARTSARVWNQIHPHYMYLTTVSLLPDTELYRQARSGEFAEESERERIEEFRAFVAGLDNRIVVDANTSANSVRFVASLPEDKDALVKSLDGFLADYSERFERESHRRREQMRTV